MNLKEIEDALAQVERIKTTALAELAKHADLHTAQAKLHYAEVDAARKLADKLTGEVRQIVEDTVAVPEFSLTRPATKINLNWRAVILAIAGLVIAYGFFHGML